MPVAEVALNPDLSGALLIEATEATRPRPHPRQIHCLVESVSEVVTVVKAAQTELPYSTQVRAGYLYIYHVFLVENSMR